MVFYGSAFGVAMSGKGNLPLDEGRAGPGFQDNLSPPGADAPARRRRRDRFMGGVFTVAAHGILLAILIWPRSPSSPSRPDESQSLTLVSIADLPKPPGPPDQTEPKPAEVRDVVTPVPPHPAIPVLEVTTTPVPDNSDLLSQSQIAGATSAGEEGTGGGGGGGSCDLARAVQRALRRDPLVRTAVEGANRQGKSIMMWNGDWVRSGGQDGKGLSAVREAIMWEVAFSPESCRNERMHGLVLLSLADGSTRFAVGSGEWRWSDLLGVRGTASAR